MDPQALGKHRITDSLYIFFDKYQLCTFNLFFYEKRVHTQERML